MSKNLDHHAETTGDRDWNAAAERLVPGATVAAVPGRPGLALASRDEERWKLRRWPATISRARLDSLHQTLAAVHAADPGLAPAVAAASDGQTAIAVGGHLVDAQSWLTGTTLVAKPELQVSDGRWVAIPAVVDDAVLARLCAAIAAAHAATAPLAANHPDAPPLAELSVAVEEAWRLQRGVLRPLATGAPAVRRWLAIGERALPAALAAFAAAAPDGTGNVVCHLGLWPAHIIVAPDAALGLIGWEHSAVGSPLIDLAQVVSRFRGWSAAGAELALAAYSDVRPLRPEDRRLLPAVAALELIASTGQLLIAGYAGRPGGTRPLTPLREGARQLLDSLDVATNTLTALTTPNKPAGREWRPSGPPRRDREPSRKPRGPKKRR